MGKHQQNIRNLTNLAVFMIVCDANGNFICIFGAIRYVPKLVCVFLCVLLRHLCCREWHFELGFIVGILCAFSLRRLFPSMSSLFFAFGSLIRRAVRSITNANSFIEALPLK